MLPFAPISRFAAVATLGLVVGSALSAQSVLVVDDDGGAGVAFTDLQPAIDAASSGDTLLIKAGVYGVGSTTTISGKALNLIADRGQRVDLAERQPVRPGEVRAQHRPHRLVSPP